MKKASNYPFSLCFFYSACSAWRNFPRGGGDRENFESGLIEFWGGNQNVRPEAGELDRSRRYSADRNRLNSWEGWENFWEIINWGVIINKKFEYTQNLHEFESIRAIWKTFQKVSKLIFKFFQLKCLVKSRNFRNWPPTTIIQLAAEYGYTPTTYLRYWWERTKYSTPQHLSTNQTQETNI